MYVKLFTRITCSSLMEEDVLTRYVFIMLLVIADAKGHVIGTDVALADRLNIPMTEFQVAVERLMMPDPESSSEKADGRRIVPTADGYSVVNFTKYQGVRNEEADMLRVVTQMMHTTN